MPPAINAVHGVLEVDGGSHNVFWVNDRFNLSAD